LEVRIPLIELEDIGIMVHEAMTVQARSFHTPAHIFELADASNPIQALAALFHDVVYYQVDEGFTPEIADVLMPYIAIDGERIRPKILDGNGDTVYRITLDVFDFEPGQTLPSQQGQNEFLSALLMNRLLADHVRPSDLAKVTACIEATIPFRGDNARGESPPDLLEQRLTALNRQLDFGMSEEAIYDAVRWAVAFSNRDVDNFSERDTGSFLDNTWKLLPETNPSLRMRGIYTIGNYRRALEKMEAFLRQLDPETIFNEYRGEPPPGEYQRMVALAHRNVTTARQYLGIKLMAAAVLEALGDITGGDAPVALFMGAIDGGEDARRMEDYLPQVRADTSVDELSTLFGLLAFGRASSSSFDLQNSPLALFIYKKLGWDRIQHLLGRAKVMFQGELGAADFLAELPPDMLIAITRACAAMASTRREALLAYAQFIAQADAG
jgi:hypothetical protein